MEQRAQIELGDEVKDPVTGASGIAVCRLEWLFGCVRIAIQRKVDKKGGEIPGELVVDEPQLIVLRRRAIVPPHAATPKKAAKKKTERQYGDRPDRQLLRR